MWAGGDDRESGQGDGRGRAGGELGFKGESGAVADVGQPVGVAGLGPGAKKIPAQADFRTRALRAAHEVTVMDAPAQGMA